MDMVLRLDVPLFTVICALLDAIRSSIVVERRHFLRLPYSSHQRLDSFHRTSQDLSGCLVRHRIRWLHPHSRCHYSSRFPSYGRRFKCRSTTLWLHFVAGIVLVGRFCSLLWKSRGQSGVLSSWLALLDGPAPQFPSRSYRLSSASRLGLDNGGALRSLSCPGVAGGFCLSSCPGRHRNSEGVQ